ncbi:hypothetical protein [Elongatibacter sediminis]|uniref:Uncharacterized protein n=1 Tax=Elongatibacter sediminis TaxID=3119006 RepID=A0AAW9REN5_9GAMM
MGKSFGASIDLAKLIDRRSFMLGMMTAFGECIAGEAKRCAFSPPFYPDDYFSLKTEAERIAGELGIELWLEENPEIDEEHRVMWWVMYKFPEVLDEYQALREQGCNPAYEFDRFRDLLSYGFAFGENAEAVRGRLREKTDTMETVTRVLFQPGDWPVPRSARRTDDA